MGALQDVLTNNRSTDIVCVTNHNRMLPYDIWVKEVNASCAGKSGPITTISAGRAECDRILFELGVIQRGYRGSQNISGSNGGLSSSNDGAVDGKVENKKIKDAQPKDLTVNKLRDLIDQDKNYSKIMEMYNFTSERVFKERLKVFGYRLLRSKLWVIKDKLWLKSDCHSEKDRTSC